MNSERFFRLCRCSSSAKKKFDVDEEYQHRRRNICLNKDFEGLKG
jgi:hypothetical protein